MEMNWSTFLLEIVNFLVLVWILKRFFYRPVIDIITRRQEKIEQTLKTAKKERQTSEELQQQYENRLAEWEREKEAARTVLRQEIDQERKHRLKRLATELEGERKKQEILANRERQESVRRLETKALALAAGFASRILTRVAGPDLERGLVEVLRQDLPKLSTDRRQTLEQALRQEGDALEVASAYPLDAAERKKLEQALIDLTGRNVVCRYRQDASLIAGLRLQVNAWVLHVNLREELKGFTEASHA